MSVEITTLTTVTVAANDKLIFTDVSPSPDELHSTTFAQMLTDLNVVNASTTEVLTGTSVVKQVTPDSLASLWEQGSNIASAGTISIGEGGSFHVTGTTTITDIDPATDKAGRAFWLIFDGILTLTYHATTLILPGSANIVTAAGDAALFISEGSDAVRCVNYMSAKQPPKIAVTVSSSATTSPTAADAGKLYRLTNASPVLALPPSAGCTVGMPPYIVQFQGGIGQVTADGADVVEYVLYDVSAPSITGDSATTVGNIPLYSEATIRYSAAGVWVMSGAVGQP